MLDQQCDGNALKNLMLQAMRTYAPKHACDAGVKNEKFLFYESIEMKLSAADDYEKTTAMNVFYKHETRVIDICLLTRVELWLYHSCNNVLYRLKQPG